MRRFILSLAFFLCTGILLFAQLEEEIAAKKNVFYVRSVINQLNAGYTRSVSPFLSVSFEAGYQFRYMAEWTDKKSIVPVELLYKNLAYSGISARFSTDFRAGPYWTISPLIGYQHLYARKIIEDDGATAGITDAPYSEYAQTLNEIIVQAILYRQISDLPVQYYFGLGIRLQEYHNAYAVEGTKDNLVPSYRTSNGTAIWFPSVIVGLKFLFAWF